jgi:hypothetical protein
MVMVGNLCPQPWVRVLSDITQQQLASSGNPSMEKWFDLAIKIV